MQTNIIINATNTAGKKIATTITYVNPNVPNNKLHSLATTLNALTTNSLTNAVKETKGEVL